MRKRSLEVMLFGELFKFFGRRSEDFDAVVTMLTWE